MSGFLLLYYSFKKLSIIRVATTAMKGHIYLTILVLVPAGRERVLLLGQQQRLRPLPPGPEANGESENRERERETVYCNRIITLQQS